MEEGILAKTSRPIIGGARSGSPFDLDFCSHQMLGAEELHPRPGELIGGAVQKFRGFIEVEFHAGWLRFLGQNPASGKGADHLVNGALHNLFQDAQMLCSTGEVHGDG